MEGKCLCGAIIVSAPEQQQIDVCHCQMCRRWSGGPMLAVHCGSAVTFSGSIKPAVYQSSDWAERGFCPQCGSHLFYHLLPADEYILPAGLFEQAFQMHSQIFIEQKPDYYEFANQTPTLTGAEVFAQFAAD
ncbi:MAG: GFA family protein [Alishewanella aestuarii]